MELLDDFSLFCSMSRSSTMALRDSNFSTASVANFFCSAAHSLAAWNGKVWGFDGGRIVKIITQRAFFKQIISASLSIMVSFSFSMHSSLSGFAAEQGSGQKSSFSLHIFFPDTFSYSFSCFWSSQRSFLSLWISQFLLASKVSINTSIGIYLPKDNPWGNKHKLILKWAHGLKIRWSLT